MYQSNISIENANPVAFTAVAGLAETAQKSWAEKLGFGISAVLLVAIAFELKSLDLAKIWSMVPVSSVFWATFAVYYLAAPVTEWFIYRRLWRLPASGLLALLRKMVSNELLLSYLGEVQFYSWARERMAMVNAPFGAIKDVAILSALTGNAVTLGLLALAWPLVGTTQIGMETRTAFLSLAVVGVTSMAILLFRRRLFSLPPADLRWITGAHLARIFIILGLSALMWHLALPQVPLGWWLVLATLRMLISRLPLIPNKDVVFAGLAAFLLGQDIEIARLMAMMAGVLLATHIIVGAVAVIVDLSSKRIFR